MTQLYIITWCYDWFDGRTIHETREDALAQIREDFDIPERLDKEDDGDNEPTGDLIVDDSKEFWELCDQAYEVGDWKSYQFLVLDIEKLTLSYARPSFPEET